MRARGLAGLLVLAVLGSPMGATAVPVSNEPGRVDVQVLDSAGAPVSGIDVALTPDESGASYGEQTDASGRVSFTAVAPDDYTVCWAQRTPPRQFRSDCWDDPETSQPVDTISVHSGETVDLSVRARPGARITGTITDVATGDPIRNLEVAAEVLVDGTWRAAGRTMSSEWAWLDDGEFEFDGLPAGTYRLLFEGADRGYIAEWWEDATTASEADRIVVDTGETVASVDAQLMPYAVVSGQVNTPYDGYVPVEIWTFQQVGGAWEPLKQTSPDSSNFYRLRLAPGTYRLKFVAEGLATEWWQDAPNLATAKDIVLAPGERVEHMDVNLEKGEPERPQNVSRPRLLGKPAAGSVLTADPGAWTPTPIGYQYYWFTNACLAYTGGPTFPIHSHMKGWKISLFVQAYAPAFAWSKPAPWMPPQDRHGCINPSEIPPGSVTVAGTAAVAPLKARLRGKAVVGRRLRVVDLPAVSGDTDVIFRWFAGGERLPQATGRSLLLRPAHLGHRIFARVTIRPPNERPTTDRTPASEKVRRQLRG